MLKAKGPSKKKSTNPRPPKDRFHILIEAVEAVQDYGIFMIDPTGLIMTWNLGAQRMNGYKASEVLGRSFSQFYTPEDIARRHPQAELKEAAATGRYEEEGWRVRKDGTRFWVHVVITRLTDKKGKILGFSKVTQDLSARREYEERLRESEERFRLLVECVKDYAIFMLDPEGRVISWNQGANRIKGYESHEIIGKPFSVFYNEEDVVAGKCEYELREASQTGRFEDEGWRVRKDGSMLWANVVITAIRDKNRKLIGFTKVTRDLTDKRRAAERVQLAYADLERRVIERTAELAKREIQLKEAIAVRDQFLSIASHELKTPITSLKMQTQILQQRLQPGRAIDPERTAKSLDVSLRQIDRLTQLVDDLLDVSRASQSQLSFKFEQTDLLALTNEVAERMQAQLETARTVLEIDAENDVNCEVDRFRLDQVLVNLVTNSLKYAPGSKICIKLRKQNGRLLLTIKDDGPGIPSESLGKLFGRFERGPNAKNQAGLGLGLFIVKHIIEGHNGVIRVESIPGKSTTFLIDLPCRQGPR